MIDKPVSNAPAAKSPALVRFPPPRLVKSPPAGTPVSTRNTDRIPQPPRIGAHIEIVLRSRVRVGERGVGVVDLDEVSAVGRRCDRGVHKSRPGIGMVQLGERTVRRLDLHLRRVLLDAEDLVEAPPVGGGRNREMRHLGTHEHGRVAAGLLEGKRRRFERERRVL